MVPIKIPCVHRLQSNIHGPRTRGACEETHRDIHDTGERPFLPEWYYEACSVIWRLIVSPGVWPPCAGRLGASAKLPSGPGVYGWAAWNHYNRRSAAWYVQGLDHHRTTQSLLHHAAAGNTTSRFFNLMTSRFPPWTNLDKKYCD